MVECLTLADELQFAVGEENFRGIAAGVVVARHRGAVSSRIVQHEQIAGLRFGEVARDDESAFLLREYVSGFAQRSADDHGLGVSERASVFAHDGDRMVGAVESRAHQIGEPRVHEVERVVALLLDGADFRDEVAAGFHFEGNGVSDGFGDALARVVPAFVISADVNAVRLVLFLVGNGEAAACGNRAHVSAEVARRVAHGAAYLRQVFEVRAASDVHVQPGNPHPVRLGELDAVFDLRVPHAVLGKVSAGVRLAGVPVAEARVHAQSEFAFDARFRELAYHVGGADVHMDAVLLDEFERVAVKDVRGVDDLGSLFGFPALETDADRTFDFPRAHGIDYDAELFHQCENGKIGTGLLSIPDHVEDLHFTHPRFYRRTVIKPKRGAEAFGTLTNGLFGYLERIRHSSRCSRRPDRPECGPDWQSRLPSYRQKQIYTDKNRRRGQP